MQWQFDWMGEWSAWSSARDDNGVPLCWTISVCDDGTFTVDQSDPELTDRKETFDTLQQAQDWCLERERELLNGKAVG